MDEALGSMVNAEVLVLREPEQAGHISEERLGASGLAEFFVAFPDASSRSCWLSEANIKANPHLGSRVLAQWRAAWRAQPTAESQPRSDENPLNNQASASSNFLSVHQHGDAKRAAPAGIHAHAAALVGL